MSLHAHHHECGHADTDDARLIFWMSWCDCGWEGERYWLHLTSEAAHRARLEYRNHVEDVLGAEAYYDASVACRNCGSEHVQGVLLGTHVTSGACSRCGTTMLQPRNDTWDEGRANSHRWSF